MGRQAETLIVGERPKWENCGPDGKMRENLGIGKDQVNEIRNYRVSKLNKNAEEMVFEVATQRRRRRWR